MESYLRGFIQRVGGPGIPPPPKNKICIVSYSKHDPYSCMTLWQCPTNFSPPPPPKFLYETLPWRECLERRVGGSLPFFLLQTSSQSLQLMIVHRNDIFHVRIHHTPSLTPTSLPHILPHTLSMYTTYLSHTLPQCTLIPLLHTLPHTLPQSTSLYHVYCHCR